ncbi:MAG: hypothetical protein F6K41_33750 [Symploca sp. SIO3E6]|nr:hypothetical protein [Caldora sp. SIO3E6]
MSKGGCETGRRQMLVLQAEAAGGRAKHLDWYTWVYVLKLSPKCFAPTAPQNVSPIQLGTRSAPGELITHYSLLITHYSLLITHYFLLITHYLLLITHYSHSQLQRQLLINPAALTTFSDR